jgi:hypothetical protein
VIFRKKDRILQKNEAIIHRRVMLLFPLVTIKNIKFGKQHLIDMNENNNKE